MSTLDAQGVLGLAVTARTRPSGAVAKKNRQRFLCVKNGLEPFWRVRDTAAFLTTLDFFDDLRGLRHLQLTFYALRPTPP